MGINLDKPDNWEIDIALSVAMYNEWYKKTAPEVYRNTRETTVSRVEDALRITEYLQKLSPQSLIEHPEVLPVLRMTTYPPLAKDRLIGLSGVRKGLVENMEDADSPRISKRIPADTLNNELAKIVTTIKCMIDPDVFMWINENRKPAEVELEKSAAIVAERLSGAVSNQIIRNAQEKRQLDAISKYLKDKGYVECRASVSFDDMEPGTYMFRSNIRVLVSADSEQTVNMPIDVLINPRKAKKGDLPVMVECKSAGDYANVNKRRKEEATKIQQLRNTFGDNVTFVLFLCGYFNSSYLGYEAAEGIDWIWEHRMSDLDLLGI